MAVGTPTAPLTNASALRRVAWDYKHSRVDSVSPSVFVALKAEVTNTGSGEIVLKKPGIVLDVTNEGKSGMGQSVRLALRSPLKGRPAYGSENPESFEDESPLKFAELFYNEINAPVKMYNYGYYKNDVEWLKFNEGYAALQAQKFQELDDYYAHQALMFTYAENLTFAPVSKVAAFNKNWWIPNLADASQPAWDTTAVTATAGAADSDGYYSSRAYSGSGTFAENLGAALTSAAGTGSTPTNMMNITAWSRLRSFLKTRRAVESIKLDSKDTYVCVVPSNVVAWMLNPSNSGSIGENFQKVMQYKGTDRDTIPGEVGRILDCFLIIEDERGATLTSAGTTGSYSLTPGYLLPGNNDDRNLSAWSNTSGSENYVHDIMLVLGRNALAKYTRDDLQLGLVDTTQYQRIKGSNAYKGEGWQIPFFDIDTPTDTSRVYRGSVCVPIGRLAA